MSNEAIVKVAAIFTRFPAGRFLADGPFSGQRFREEHVEPFLKNGQKVVIDFDGALGYGSSFLEEAFGGLVRAGFKPEVLFSQLVLKSSDESLKLEIKKYITRAGAAQ